MVENSISLAKNPPSFTPHHAAPNWVFRALSAIAILAMLFGLQILLRRYFNSYITQIIALVGVNIIMAVSLNLINGITGQFSLGHAGFMAIGAYASAAFSFYASPYLALPPQIIFAIAIVLGAVAAGLAGLLVGLPSLRLRGDYLAIVTLGFNQIIISIIQNAREIGGATGFNSIPQYADLVWIFAFVILCVVCVRNLSHSQLGRSMKAIRDDEVAAEAVGINTTGIKVLAFVVSAMWAGIAGALQVHYLGSANPDSFTFVKSVEIVVMVVLGGLGSITGSVVSATGLKFLEEALRSASSVFWVVPLLVRSGTVADRLDGVQSAQRSGQMGSRGAVAAVIVLVVFLWFASQNQGWLESNKGALRYVIYALILIGMMLVRPEGSAGTLGISVSPSQNAARRCGRALKALQNHSSGQSNFHPLSLILLSFPPMLTLHLSTENASEMVNITADVRRLVEESGVRRGLCTVYSPHTTAGIVDSGRLRPRCLPRHHGYHFAKPARAASKAITGTPKAIRMRTSKR